MSHLLLLQSHTIVLTIIEYNHTSKQANKHVFKVVLHFCQVDTVLLIILGALHISVIYMNKHNMRNAHITCVAF